MVLDTNILIDGFSDDFSHQARLIDAAANGEVIALVTAPIVREYKKILHRLIDNPTYKERISDFLIQAEEVDEEEVDIEIDDPDDYKFLQAAVGGEADLIVSNDRHLLDVGEVEAIRIVTPQEAWSRVEEAVGSNEWDSYVKGWGIGE